MAKRKMPAALARYWRDKRSKKRGKRRAKKSTPHKSKRTNMAKKRKSGKRSRRGGGRRAGAFLNRKTMVIVGTCLAAGYLTKKAAEGSADSFKDMPVITPLGRWGTMALAAGGLYMAGIGRRTTAPLAIALGGLALFTYGRRGGLYNDEASVRADILGAGEDEAVYLEGNAEDFIEVEAAE